MPNPIPDETVKEFMARCIPMVMEDGTAENNKQAVAVCTMMWEKRMHQQTKAGARHSKQDVILINDSRVKLRDIDKNLVDLGAEESAEPDANAPADNTPPTAAPMAKAFALTAPTEGAFIIGAVKASGDWQLDVLAIPYGGPKNGKDSDGQYFSTQTQLYEDKYPSPLVVYYHGYGPDGMPQGKPEIIGEIAKRWTDSAGRWVRVKLDRLSEWAQRVWAAAAKDKARASSGSIVHLVRVAADGLITHWPFAELSLFDTTETRQPANAYAVAIPVMKAAYLLAGKDLPDFAPIIINDSNAQPQADTTGESTAAAVNGGAVKTTSQGEFEMDEKQINDAVAAALKAQSEAAAAEAARKAAEQTRIDDAVKAEKAKWEADAAKGRRLPIGDGAPYIAKDGDLWKYDGLDASEQAVMIGVLQSAHKNISGPALKALAVKLEGDKTETGELGRRAMKAAGMKTGEIDYSTSGSYGDEWVGIAYSNSLWEAIRVETQVLNKLPQQELPPGVESIYLPLESTDPIWYNVAENTTNGSTVGTPAPTVTSSRLTTGRVSLTLAKLGARVVWSGELDESSLVPFAGQLKAQLATSGAEYLESAVIDGDTTLTTANINATDGAGGGATDWFTVFAGMRMSALITTAANSRSAAGSLDVTDYLETVKLMGTGGKNALDVTKVGFIVDASTHFKTLALPELLTRDVASSPTIEGGRLVNLWGYPIIVSGSMCKNSAKRLSTSAGDISLTDSGNLYGTIVATRYDQWKFGWRRRMTMETTRFANSDSNEIVAMLRCGLIQRDTEASAVTYYVGV